MKHELKQLTRAMSPSQEINKLANDRIESNIIDVDTDVLVLFWLDIVNPQLYVERLIKMLTARHIAQDDDDLDVIVDDFEQRELDYMDEINEYKKLGKLTVENFMKEVKIKSSEFLSLYSTQIQG